MTLSLRPSTFSQGGLIDDIDVLIKRARFVPYDFEGAVDPPATCLLLEMEDNDGNVHPQYFSAGSPEYFVPSVDPKNEELNGITIVPVGDKKALNGGTNCAILINSLVNAGFPEDKLESGDVRELEDTKVHVNRVPAPKRNNLPKKPGQKDRDPMVMVVTAIIHLPGEGGAAAKKSSGTATAKTGAGTGKPNGAATQAKSGTAQTASPSSGPDPELLAELGGELMGLFASKEVTSMKKVELTKGLFASIDKTNTSKNKLIAMAGRDDALRALEGFQYDGSVLSIAE
jgi:hypothetical protein